MGLYIQYTNYSITFYNQANIKLKGKNRIKCFPSLKKKETSQTQQ